MAEENKTPNAEENKTPKKKDNRVEVFIPRGPERDEANLFVAVNGKSYLLPKGKTSLVPPEVAEEIKRANKAQEALDNRKDELLNATQIPKIK